MVWVQFFHQINFCSEDLLSEKQFKWPDKMSSQSRIWQACFWLDISWHLTNKQLCSMKDTPFNLISCCWLIFFAPSTCTVEPPLLGHLSTRVTLFHSSRKIYAYLNLPPMATSLQRQQPLTHVCNSENNLSTTASFFQRLMNGHKIWSIWYIYGQSLQLHFDFVSFMLL